MGYVSSQVKVSMPSERRLPLSAGSFLEAMHEPAVTKTRVWWVAGRSRDVLASDQSSNCGGSSEVGGQSPSG
jgi:hypothetical protein